MMIKYYYTIENSYSEDVINFNQYQIYSNDFSNNSSPSNDIMVRDVDGKSEFQTPSFFTVFSSKKEFEKYKISTNDIGPNFFLLNFNKCKLSANKVEKKLENYGIILREMKSYRIKNCLRLTIGNNKENLFLI